MNMAWRLCASCTLCILFLHLQRWRLAELRLEEYAFVVLARLIGMFEDQVRAALCVRQRCANGLRALRMNSPAKQLSAPQWAPRLSSASSL